MWGMQKNFMTPKEVSQMLSISVSAVNTLARTGELISVSNEDTGLKCFLKKDVLVFAREHEIPVNDPGKNGYRVLIVDDEESFAQMLEKWIEALPYEFEIDVAHNGFQAGYKARQYAPDLIFLDVMMPGVSGMEVVAALKSEPKTEHIRIIGLTGAATENTEMIINYNGIPVFAVFNFSVGLSVVCYSAEPPNLCTKPTPTASALPVD